MKPASCLSAALEVLLQHREALRLISVVGHDRAAAAHHLAGGALRVQLAEPRPLPELLVLGDGDQVDVVLAAQRLDQLLVVGLVAVLGEDAELRLALLDGARRLVEAAGEAVVREGLLEDELDGGVDVHGLAGGGGGGLHHHGGGLLSAVWGWGV